MSLQHLTINQLVETQLQRLVDDAVAESKTLEYKADLQLQTDEQKREFLSDLTALANTDGGDLVLGIRAEKGVAVELVGLKGFIPDDRLGQIENLLRDSVQPRIAGIQPRVVPLGKGLRALILRVPRSLNAPHMVRHQGITRFCGRNSNGKYDLDVNELRSAFLASEGLSERLRNFRLDRINKLASGTTPVPLTSRHLMVLHLLPVVSARPDIRFGVGELSTLVETNLLRPFGSSGWGPHYTMDGLMVASSWKENSFHGYVQLFRNGYLESVESQSLVPRDDNKTIPSIAWERYILHCFGSYLRAFEALKLPPPYVASLSLLNVRGYSMLVGPRYDNPSRPVNQDHLLTDEILIESPTEKPHVILRPLFDQIWNGCGWPKSINYDIDGNWKERS